MPYVRTFWNGARNANQHQQQPTGAWGGHQHRSAGSWGRQSGAWPRPSEAWPRPSGAWNRPRSSFNWRRDANQGVNATLGPNNAPGSLHADTPLRSANQDFSNLVKNMNKYMTVLHHHKNWNTLPKGINMEVDKLFQSINQPCPDLEDKDNNQFKRISDGLKNDIQKVGLEQLNSKWLKLEMDIKKLDHTDWERAINIASGQVKRKLGRRLSPQFFEDYKNRLNDLRLVPSTIQNSLNNAKNAHQSTPETSHSTAPQAENPSTPKTSNLTAPKTPNPSTSDIVIINDPPPSETDMDVAETPFTDVAEKRKNKRKLESPGTSPITVSNKYQVLSDSDSYDGEVESSGEDSSKVNRRPSKKALKKSPQKSAENSDKSKEIQPSVIETRIDNDLSELPEATNEPEPTKNTSPVSEPSADMSEESSSQNEIVENSVSASISEVSAEPVKKQNKPIVHLDTYKNRWNIKLKEKTTVLVIGDENLRRENSLPDSWEAHIFPDANLRNTEEIIKKLNITNNLKDLIICVGRNTKKQCGEGIRKDANALILAAKNKNLSMHFVGIRTSEEDDPSEKSQMDLLNNHMYRKLSTNYIRTNIPESSQEVGTGLGVLINHFLSKPKRQRQFSL